MSEELKSCPTADELALWRSRCVPVSGDWRDRALIRCCIQLENTRPTPALDKACPCHHVEPCHPRCTCANPTSSHGCYRCCSYGSPEQQKAAAERLVSGAALDKARAALEPLDVCLDVIERDGLAEPFSVVYWRQAPTAIEGVSIPKAVAFIRLDKAHFEKAREALALLEKEGV